MVSRFLAAAVLVLGIAQSAWAAPEMAPPGPLVQAPPDAADPLRVFVMTMGPGDHPFFASATTRSGSATRRRRTDRVYNFGTFRFDSPRLILDFLGGRLNYWLSVSSLPQRDRRSTRARTAASRSRS